MPVILPPPPQTAFPKPPNRFVWLVVFMVVVAAGAGHALWTWPKGVPTHTAWFWVRVAVFPVLAGVGLFGLRLMYFEQETERLTAEQAQWQEDRDEAVRFAQEPLAVIDFAYLSAFGGLGASERMVKGDTLLQSQKPTEESATVRHTALSGLVGVTHTGRFEAAFVELLDRLDNTIHTLAPSIPLEVYLQLSDGTDQHEVLEVWQTCWSAFGYRPVQAVLLSPQQDLMVTDAWLDSHGGPALEKFALFVAVQLHVTPPANSAEAAVAMLLGWAPLAQRKEVPMRALWHRPVEVRGHALHDAMPTALLWGDAQEEQIANIWQAGLARSEKSAVLKASSDLGTAASKADGVSGVHDVDLALGNPGVATSWLTAAFAAEHAAQTNSPQLLVTRQHNVYLSVVQSLPAQQDVGQQV